MTLPCKATRFDQFINRLNSARQAEDREDAHSLMTEVMNNLEDGYGFARNDYTDRMHVFPMTPDFGWKNLDGDPCYWDDSVKAKHRTEIFHDGRIVITQKDEAGTVVIDKSGA